MQRALGIALLVAFSIAESVSAASIVVSATADILADDGVCTLREAVIAANTDAASGTAAGECGAGSGADVIELPAGVYTLAVAGMEEAAAATGDLDLQADVEVEGAGVAQTIIDGADLDRVFHVLGGVVAEIRDVTIQNGHHTFRGGGIQNLGTLTLRRATLRLNFSGAGLSEVIGSGGGVHNASGAALTVEDCTLLSNSAEARGGGIFNEGALVLRTSLLAANSSFRVGGLGGGGLAHRGISADLSDCTFSRNSATGRFGGGSGAILVESAPLSLTHCTVTGNSSVIGTDGIYGGVLTLANVILDDNCASASTTSLGGNVETAGSTCGLTDPSDQVDVAAADLALAALADNGGPTQTHAIGAASVARDAALAASCTATDQRGLLRPDGDGAAGAACDAGAYELECAVDPDLCEEPPPPPPPPPLAIEIDVRPGNEHNRIRPDRGVVRVAILGASAFAVEEIDLSTLGFGPNAASPQRDPKLGDVNKDGVLDLALRFESAATGLVDGDTEACLVGTLIDDTEFEGCDSVTTVGGSKAKVRR